jgi:predicted RND superfamily exporter protein
MFLVVLVGLLFGVPFWLTRRRNRRAAAAGKPLTEEIKGAGHGFAAAGSVVHFLARWRVITVPMVVVLAIVGGWAAFQVESAFEIKDFFSSRTAFVKSVEKVETHLGSSASAPAFVYVEGDLTAPGTLLEFEAALSELDDADVELVRDYNGDIEISLNSASLVRLAMTTPGVAEAVTGASGVSITDADGDGLPDAPEQVGALYDFIAVNGIPGDGFMVLRPDQVEQFLYMGEGAQGTRLEVIVPSVTDDANVLAVRAELDRLAADIEDSMGSSAALVRVSGGAITGQAGLAAFTGAMVTSLPLAVAITVILALLVMRSVRYALISMVPILLVVAWLYGFMYVFDYKINVITATIAAIAIGVGIDYATHFTMRFRQEFVGEPSRFPALRRAGVGTGGALALSALTSMTGFLVMATSPMPMFATFGMLTAVMILLALVVSLAVLPSLLILPFVTPSRKGEERAGLEEAITGGEFEYRPHDRSTADLRRPDLEGEEQGSEG